MMNEVVRVTGVIESVNCADLCGILKTEAGKEYRFTFSRSNAYLFKVGVSVDFEPSEDRNGLYARNLFDWTIPRSGTNSWATPAAL